MIKWLLKSNLLKGLKITKRRISRMVRIPENPPGHAWGIGEAARRPDEREIRKITSFGPTKRSGPTWWKVNVEIRRSLAKRQNVNKQKWQKRKWLSNLRVLLLDDSFLATLHWQFVSFTRKAKIELFSSLLWSSKLLTSSKLVDILPFLTLTLANQIFGR